MESQPDDFFSLNGTFGDGTDPTSQLQSYKTCEYTLYNEISFRCSTA